MNVHDRIRTFVGVPLSGPGKEAILDLQERLRGELSDQGAVKWERVANLHVTLSFLGDTRHDALEEIANSLERATKDHRQFTLTLSAPKIFGGKQPRVFVVSMGSGSDELKALQADVALELDQVGFSPEQREYSPHVTIGRVRRNRRLPRGEADRMISEWSEMTVGATMDVTEIVHFESQLSPRGATYTRLKTVYTQGETLGFLG